MEVDGALRCAAIFAERDDVVPRTFRIRGPEPIGLDHANQVKTQQLDKWVEDYMRAHNFRGAAMAVVEGTRLVYAKGYTLAESGYREIQPTTLFRMASVSKTFCAVAVWKALADDPNVSRNSKMQSVLGLEQPNGSNPKDSHFANITIRHLLGLIAAKLAGVTSFESALEKLVLKPLKMTRTRGSRSHVEAKGDDEAQHHLPDLNTNTSAVHNDRRIVPVQYGDENYEVYDGAGGISSAVVDVARLCAMLSWRTNNPLFSDSMLADFLSDAVAATSVGSDHGYHGFDWAKGTYPSVPCTKGGGNPGVGAGLYGTTGRRFIVIARNGEKIEDATPVNWNTDLDAIAATINWNGGDLFPHFGMPAIPG